MKKKLTVLIILIGMVVLFLICYYPAQRILALNKFDDYSQLQGVDKKYIDQKSIYKNYKDGGYIIQVHYKNDPAHMYTYRYFPITHRKHESIKFHRMDCEITSIHESLVVESPYDDSIKYPSLGSQ